MKSTCAATTRLVRAFALATGMPLLAALPPPAVAGATSAPAVTVQANPLLSIDQNRATVVERIVATWGDALAASGAGLDKEHLQTLLLALRADHLFAASLAGSLDGLRNVIAKALTANAPVAPALLHAKALGDTGDDLVYTPVTPCRLVETRGTFAAVYQGDGSPSHLAVPFAGGEIRSYTELGANSVCLSQLPAGLNPSAVQLQVFGIPINGGASGDIEILPQGSTFGSTSTLIYLGNIAFTSASATAKVNLANNQIGVQVRGGGANVAIDMVGYFRRPLNATTGAFEVSVNNALALRIVPDAVSPLFIAGSSANSITAGASGSVIGGGGATGTTLPPLGDNCSPSCANAISVAYGTIAGGVANTVSGATFGSVGGGFRNTSSSFSSTVAGGNRNTASGTSSTVGGGENNTASGGDSTVAGGAGNIASGTDSFAAGVSARALYLAQTVFSDFGTTFFEPVSQGNWGGDGSNTFNVRARGGVLFVTGIDGSGNTTQRTWFSGGNAYTTFMFINASDRNSKDRFAAISSKEVLRKLTALPVTLWSYKGQNERHLGPTAQDFRAAFNLGQDDKTIGSLDSEGVALAAIQGLNAKVEQNDAALRKQIRAKDAEIAALRNRLAQVETANADAKGDVAELRRSVEVLMARTSPDGRVAQAH